MKKLLFSPKSYNELRQKIKENSSRKIINFMNANDIYEFVENKTLKKAIIDSKKEREILVDGTTTSILLSIKNLKKIKKLPGPEFTDNFLKDEEMLKNKKHFFLGISQENLKKVLEKYPLLNKKNIYGQEHPFIEGYHFPKEFKNKIITDINKNQIDYLWVGAGCPRQDILVNEIYKKIKVKQIFNVGAALEYIQGKRKRAPKFWQKLGLEWFYRLFSDFHLTKKRILPCIKGTFYAFFMAELKK